MKKTFFTGAFVFLSTFLFFYCAKQVDKDTGSTSATFSSINSNIIQAKCITCHATANSGNGNVDLSSYARVIATAGVFSASSPTSSKFFTQINAGLMPLGGSKLSDAQIQAVSDWVTAGALNN